MTKIKAFNDMNIPDSILNLFYEYIKKDCYYGEYQSVEIPSSMAAIKDKKEKLLYMWLLENGAEYGEIVVVFYNNPDYRKSQKNGVFYDPKIMDLERRELYGSIENIVGFCTNSDRMIKEKLDQFFQKQDNKIIKKEDFFEAIKNMANSIDFNEKLKDYMDGKKISLE